MSGKTINITKRPSAAGGVSKNPDKWVAGEGKPQTEGKQPETVEEMKRLTIDVPESMHRRLKTHCSAQGTTIALWVRTLIEQSLKEKP
jgi:hypothetical protein